MSYLDFMHAAQAPDDAKEAARKLAEAKQGALDDALCAELGIAVDAYTEAEDAYRVASEIFKRGPGRPKKQP